MTPLRIGVDARELLGDTTGVGRYLGELLRQWTARSDAAGRRFVLYTPEPLSLALPAGSVDYRVGGRGRGTWWEQTWLRRSVTADRPDVFFAPAYTAPLGLTVPLAVTIHDVSFTAHPEWFRMREGFRRRWLTRHAANLAAAVFTDSEFSRSEILTHLRIDARRLHVIPPGAPARVAVADRIREPIVLYSGSLFNRRRLPDLIAAFARATADLPQSRLVIVGSDRTWPPLDLPAIAARHGVADRTIFRPYVAETELADLYARASVFGFLSEYEGFGLTPLEAMSAGVPVVVLDTPVAREVYGEAAHYVAAGDVEGTAQALRRYLTQPAARDERLVHAPATLARYSWDTAAARTLSAIEAIAAR